VTDNHYRRRFLVGSTLAATALPGVLRAESEPDAQPLPKRGIEGFIAPEIELDYWIDRNGEPSSFSMHKSRGKWVFLKYFQNWCPGCHKSGFPTLKAFADRFHDHPDVAIAAVQTVFEGYSSNTLEDVRKLQQRYELPITMGHDEGSEIPRELPAVMVNYRTGGTPWLVLVAPDGAVVASMRSATKLLTYSYMA